MLETLHRIVKKVNAAPDLSDALSIIVRLVKEAVAADVCSVYLTDFERRCHVLRATDGLHQEAVGKASLPLYRGLTGLVCERAETINLDDATSHPRYLFISETGETRYHGYLGVPIIQHRKVLGVLVVRREEVQRFNNDEVTFLFTLAAQLAGAITHARASGDLNVIEASPDAPKRFLRGRPSASGVAIGTAVVAYRLADLAAVPDRSVEDPDKEITDFHTAVTKVEEDLRRLQASLDKELPPEDLAMFDALLLMLGGDTLVTETVERIKQGQWVQSALHHTVEKHAQLFDNMVDAYLRERASDIRDLGRRILMHLQSERSEDRVYPEQTILVGGDVSALQLAEVPKGCLVGVVSAKGSGSSHVAILARAMGVPAVMGVIDLPAGRVEGHETIIDGYRGRVYLSPVKQVKLKYARLAREDRELSEELEQIRGLPAETSDGSKVPLYLNTGLISELSQLGTNESEGIGLYRTELLYMVRDRFPGESEQAESYSRVLKSFAPNPVILRTLDIGGDKPLSYFPVEESNPFLGWRGVRISLDHPEIFITQIRAMLRASVGNDNLQIMLPMISAISEVDELMLLIQRAFDELEEEGYKVIFPKIG